MGNLPYTLEQDLFDRKNRALDYIKQGASADPMTLGRLLGIARTWPSITPGVALSLSAAGYDRTSPETHTAAQLSLKQAMNQDDWGQTFANHPDKHHDLKDYSGDEQKQVASKHPDPEFVLQSLLPKWQKLQAKGGENFSDKDIATQRQLNAGLSYAALHYSDRELNDIAGQLGLNHKQQGALRQLASTARSEHDIGGGDLGSIPYAGPVLKAAQTGVREAAAVANMPLQGVQGAIRNVASGGNPFFGASGQTAGYQTDVGQQFSNLVQGKTTDLGDGFLPDPKSPIAKQTLAAQQAAAPMIGGHAFTLGRAVANQVLEPDTDAFNILSGIVDAGVALKGDPTAAIAATIGDMRAASKTFEPATFNTISTATGLYPTTSRKFLDQTTKGNYLASDGFATDATKIMDAAGSDGNTSRMMRVINDSNLNSPSFPITTVHGQELVKDLSEAAKTNDLDAFRTALAKATEVTSPIDAPGVSYKLRQGADQRIFAAMPYGSIADPYDKNTNWKILDDVMRGGNVPIAERDAALHKYITDPSPMAGISAVSDTIKHNLVHRYGIDPAEAERASTFFKDAHNTSRLYDVDQATGVERVKPGIGIAGDGFPVSAPSLSSEGLNTPISIPDMRTLRRMASDFNYVTATAPWKVTQTALAAPSMLWKPLQVLTARMAVRIFGETQLNNAARGSINAFTSPIDFISTLMGTNYDKRWSTLLDKIPGLDAKYIAGPDGRAILDDTDNLLMHSASFIHDPETIATKGYHLVPITHPDAGYGLAEQLGRMHADPIMRGVSLAENPAAAKEAFWSGELKDARLARAPIVANEDAHNMAKLAAGKLTGYDPIGDIAGDRAAADRYLDKVMYPRLTDMTGGGHPDLLGAVQTGKLNGRTIYNVPGNIDLATIDQRAAAHAKSLLDSGVGPQRGVPLREVLAKNGTDASRAAHYARTAIDWTFAHLVDAPDRVLNRNPTFAQARWDNAEQLAPYLRDEDLPKLIENAERANLPEDQLARLRNVTLDQTSSQRLTLDQLTKLSKANALDDSRKIVHDLTTRSQFFDMARMLVPFGDAFRLIATRMYKLATEEPQVIRRVQQGLQEAQSPGSSAINRALGDPIGPNQGFFHTDPQTGEEVFTYPGSTMLDQSLLGVPIPLQGQVSGLNMIGEGYPGLGGPAVTIPAKWFLPDTPTGNSIRDIIFPYGGSESQGVGADLGNTFIPSWLSKVVQGAPDQKTFNSLTLQVMQTLMSQGGYDKKNPDDMARLASDAKHDARWLYVIRGAAQFVTPGAPTPDFHVEDKNGHLVDTYVMSQKWRDVQAKKGPDAALKWVIDNLGSKNIFLTQSASVPNSYAAPSTKQAQAWVDEHPGIADKLPLTYGLLAPAKGDFSIDAYNEQFTKGERRSLSPKEQIAQAENRLGFYAYDRQKTLMLKENDGVNFDANQQAWLRKYRTYLKEQFPGFDTFLASPYDSQKRRNSAIEELQGAVKDKDVLGTDAGRGLKRYLEYRQEAIDEAKGGGLASPFQAKRAQGLREWLRTAADAVVQDHPEFRPMFEQIFAHEFTTEGK